MIIGHKKQIQRLQALHKRGQIPHSLLFSGPEGTGKKVVANWFLKMINCLKEASCGICDNCRAIEENVHPDVFRVAPQGKEIHLGQVEEMMERISHKGVKARLKGVLIDNAHLMNLQAQNSLLKVLEEPPQDTLIILITEYPRVLLPTITSRTFCFKFSFVPQEEIAESLSDKEAAFLSVGRPGLAIKCKNCSREKERMESRKEEAKKVVEGDISERFSTIKKVIKEERTEEFLSHLLRITKDGMKRSLEEGKCTDSHREVIKEIERTLFLYSKTNINKQLALERIAIKLQTC